MCPTSSGGPSSPYDAMQIMELGAPPETVDTWFKLIRALMFFNAAEGKIDK
jgi:hypothetical protein